jgi:hypothetical protein
MIIDCCKMTPVQSQYCMFSMIISFHFSHMYFNTVCDRWDMIMSLPFSHSHI